jgi:hypothetical protein
MMSEDLNPWNLKDLYKLKEAYFDEQEARLGWVEDFDWKMYLGRGVSVCYCTPQSHSRVWPGGAGNWAFSVDGKEFAIIGMSQVHDQLYLSVPEGDEHGTTEWLQACNRLLAENDIAYRVLAAGQMYQNDVTAKYTGEHPLYTDARPLMRVGEGFSVIDGQFHDVAVGTTFMAKMHGQPFVRNEPDSDLDYHILSCTGHLSL